MEKTVNSNIVAVTLENFQQAVLQASQSSLVLVDFWAQQVPESIELRDKLVARVSQYPDVLTLATVDCETEQQIAQQFGIQGLPTAVLLKDSQPIDGLSGPQTDESIEEFLAKYLPKEQDSLLADAKQLLAENNVNEAFSVIEKAFQLDNTRADIKLVLIDVYIQTGKIAEGQSLLDSIMMVDQDSYYHSLVSKLELASQAADSPEIKALEDKIVLQPDNIELSHQLAAQYSQVNRHEDALALLFALMQKDSTDSESKQIFLDVMKALPDGDVLANKFRRKLYTLLY
jgi:putative thioredoxin